MASREHKARKLAALSEIRVVEGILRKWDPIGVKPVIDAPADEYDSYAPHMVSMVKAGCSLEQLATHLEHLAVSVIGVGSDEEVSRQVAAETIHALNTQGSEESYD